MYAVIITHLSSPMYAMVIAHFARPMHAMVVARLGMGAVAAGV